MSAVADSKSTDVKRKAGRPKKAGPSESECLFAALVVITGSAAIAYKAQRPLTKDKFLRDYATLHMKREGVVAKLAEYSALLESSVSSVAAMTPEQMDAGILEAAYRQSIAVATKPADRARALEAYSKARDRIAGPAAGVAGPDADADLDSFLDTLVQR